jgi:transcriptional regulator with XRE-family HTH domain
MNDSPDLLQTTRALLDAHRGSWPAISAQTRVSYSWLSKFARGEAANPTFQRVQRLHDHLQSLEAAKAAAA